MTLLRLEWRTAHYTPLFAETDPALLSFRQKGDDPEEGKDARDFHNFFTIAGLSPPFSCNG
jgi:hypothetical protein